MNFIRIFHYPNSVWQTSQAACKVCVVCNSLLLNSFGTSLLFLAQNFEVDLQMGIPVQNIEYIPDVGETLKHAWIQIISVFWAIYFFVNIARSKYLLLL